MPPYPSIIPALFPFLDAYYYSQNYSSIMFTDLVTGAVTQYQKALCVCGYHVYEYILEVAVGETIMVKQFSAY